MLHALREHGRVDEQVDAAALDVDLDLVAVLDERERPAFGGLRLYPLNRLRTDGQGFSPEIGIW